MLKKIAPIFTTAFLFLSLFANNILACACCVEKGHYSISVTKPDTFLLNLLKDINFSTSTLFTDAGYPDNVRGINPLNNKFTVNGALSGDIWSFDFKDDKGLAGKLNLLKPKSILSYMVDLYESDDSKVSSVQVYKELRFNYKMKNGTGIFSNGINQKTNYFLVLQGRGNACTNARDFTHWRLEVNGKKADYAFYGKLSGK